jgi:hypothetical protein
MTAIARRNLLAQHAVEGIIPYKAWRKPYDREAYHQRHLIERMFTALWDFRTTSSPETSSQASSLPPPSSGRPN